MLVLRDHRFLLHDPGANHPECPARLQAVHEALDRARLPGLREEAPPLAPVEALTRVHGPELVQRLEATAGARSTRLDPDTVASEASWTCARLAAGAAMRAAAAVSSGEAGEALALVRPPGHHAEPDRAMGFCLLNNVAVAAEAAIRDYGVERVLILDMDVHHGNGTQRIFSRRGDVFFASSHRWPFYPGTGAADERGEGPGAGATLNLPLPADAGDDRLLDAWYRGLGPELLRFRPELILVSAGFDAWQGDPVGGLGVSLAGFRRLTALFREWALQFCHGRIAWVLEGGYDPEALAAAVLDLAQEAG
ncbi:MAG: histone deacetylase [Planctomycetota bacterium]|nr:MAG: histone deacetylase [Planctomycetota bacterium]